MPTRPVDIVVITTKGLQDRNINVLDGTTVENKGKLIHSFMLKSKTTFIHFELESFHLSAVHRKSSKFKTKTDET